MNAIVVVDQNWAIGRDGDLLFSLPTDMKRFRSLTLGGTVIMGRKTLDSFPGGNPLSQRRNIVITHNADIVPDGYEVSPTPEAALKLAGGADRDDVWVIGGGSTYTALLQRCRWVYLTRVDAEAENADTFFPNLDKLPSWEVEERSEPLEENGLTYRFFKYANTRV